MNRNIRFGLFLSPAERLLLDRLAKAEGGLSRAATLRRLLHQAALARNISAKEKGSDPKEGEDGIPQ